MIARSFRIYDRANLHRVLSMLAPLMVSPEKPIILEVADYKAPKTRQQEKLFHSILQDVSANLLIGGRKFSLETLKEYFARKYLGTVEMVMPDGEIVTRRKSTAEASVEDYSKMIDQTLAELASEHGYLPQDMAA